jgi:hypothetical protein
MPFFYVSRVTNLTTPRSAHVWHGVISSNFVGMQVARGSALVELINTVNHDELCPVKTRKKDVMIPLGQSVKLSCRANTGPPSKPSPIFFKLTRTVGGIGLGRIRFITCGEATFSLGVLQHLVTSNLFSQLSQ